MRFKKKNAYSEIKKKKKKKKKKKRNLVLINNDTHQRHIKIECSALWEKVILGTDARWGYA